MSLLADIVAWSQADLPVWQQDALRRLFQQECALTQEDYSELFGLLKASRGITSGVTAVPLPLSNAHIPSTPVSDAAVVLGTLRNLQHVNRLASGQSLTFSPSGITVIYGPNASGKSGYARVLKRACRARDSSEVVLADARSQQSTARTPTAVFEIEKAGRRVVLEWKERTPPPTSLSELAVFDSRCARLYLTQEQEVAYLPYGLDIVEALAKEVIPALGARLDYDIAAISVDAKAFEHLLGDTEVGRLVSGLSHVTKPEAIGCLANLSTDDEMRLERLHEALNETDPKSKARELRVASKRIKELVERIDKVEVCVSEEVVETLSAQHAAAVASAAAEAFAADQLRAGESLLAGTGDSMWKVLYEAARRFSVESAYPDRRFPHTDTDALCPLCQQKLSPEAASRLHRFEEHVQNDIARRADRERESLEERKIALRTLNFDVGLGEALQSELELMDSGAARLVHNFERSLELRRDAIVEALEADSWETPPPALASPRGQLRSLAARLLWRARPLEKAGQRGQREALTAEYEELSARSQLAKSQAALLEHLSNLKRKHCLEQCRADLKTKPISDRARDFANSAVTESLRDALADEFEALNVGDVKLRLDSRIDKGKIKHRLVLDLPATHKLSDILSEGEQRAIALASFMAELSLSGHRGGIVFDDPVSSLDHWRRQRVAKRLVAEAGIRQVIVFTHDTSFLGQLRDEIQRSGVAHLIHTLEWAGDRPGFVREGLPWDHQGYMERLETLKKAGRSLEAIPWPTYPNEEQVSQIAEQYSRLRATIERVIQDLLFCGVIVRFSDYVNVGRLPEVIDLQPSEAQELRRLHKRCSQVTEAHDSSSFKDDSIPTAKDFSTDIELLCQIVDSIKARRSKKDSASVS